MAELIVTGGKELEAALRNLGAQVAGRLGSNSVRAGARTLARAVRARAPVRTGALKKSIVVREDVGVRLGGGSTRVASVQVRAFYARFVEFGTVRMAAKPFVRPAVDENAQTVVDSLIDNLGAGIKRETAKYRRFP